MTSLNEYLPNLGVQDTKKKLTLGADVAAYLSDNNNLLECDDLGAFIDGVVSWLSSSNFKVALNGLEIIILFVDRMKEDFKPYISTVLPAATDRLSDAKEQVREQAQALIQNIMNEVAQPQIIFDKLLPAFSHKNAKVREEIMICLQTILNKHGAQALYLSKLVPLIVKLLSDPTPSVRDVAISTLVEIYRHVGERVRLDLTKKYSIQPAKLQAIYMKFDEVRDSGQMVSTANLLLPQDSESRGDDETDRASKRASSAPPVRRVFAVPKPPANVTAQAGAVDEETFIRCFEDVPKVQLFSPKELEEQILKCRDILSDSNNDWEKRVDAMKKIRSLLIAGEAIYDELYPHLRILEPPFQSSVKDLRSQVVRETCITIAYLSQQLGHRLDHFAEALLPSLINLIPNCAKVMATAGIVAIRFIIQYTHASRLIPIITSNLSSKSKEIRKFCCEFLDQLLHTWPTHTLERHIAILQEAIKKSISDADPEARASARKAFWGFREHFRDQADCLLNSLDSSKQKMLQGEQSSMSNSSSNNSLYNNSGKVSASRSRTSSAGGSTENLSRISSLGPRRSNIPVLSSPRCDSNNLSMNGSYIPSPLRSNSAIDMNAVQRARTRQAYMAAARLKVGSTASLPRPVRKTSDNHVVSSTVTSPERSRSRSRVGVSQSQPSSRSGSPSSRLSYATYNTHATDGGSYSRPRRISGSATHSTGASRETSPNRHMYAGHDRLRGQKKYGGYLISGDRGTPGASYTSKSNAGASHHTAPPMAHKMLMQSREAEVMMADALASIDRPVRRRYDNESDDSETSSVCSERSYGSLGRSINLFNWHNSMQRLIMKEHWDYVGKDVSDIMHNLSSQHWSDRKEGLLGLHSLLQANRLLNPAEVKRVTEIFSKMFMDSHTKVFSIFLDTLNELIITHKMDLHDWVFMLLTRLFNKLGADLLGSIQAKIQKTLNLVRESFPLELQYHNVLKFSNDPTQTPNVKVKLAMLNHLQLLGQMMNASDFQVTQETLTAFSKIVMWTSDPKSGDLRKAAQTVIVTYFNLNIPEFTKLLNQLPKPHQDNATKLLHNIALKNSYGNLSSPASSRPKYYNSGPNVSRSGVHDYDNTENLNPEEIYNSLRETSNEIQNYSFDSSESSFTKEKRVNDMDRDTNSQDSGISQMSIPDGRMDPLEEKYESSPETISPDSKIDHNSYYFDQNLRNSFDRHTIQPVLESDLELLDGLNSLSLDSIDDILSDMNNQVKREDERLAGMGKLLKLIKEVPRSRWELHFKNVLRALMETLVDTNSSVRAETLRVLSELLSRHSVLFQGFAELTILKSLEAHKDLDKDVVRAAELCSATVARVLPAEQCVRVLNPIIQTGDFPVNQAAIKMLSKVVENMSSSDAIPLLPTVMPSLIKAYDNMESSVRKAAVFCMVGFHALAPDAVNPHLAALSGSKLKLLNVYIKRAQLQGTGSQCSSSPGSPKSLPHIP